MLVVTGNRTQGYWLQPPILSLLRIWGMWSADGLSGCHSFSMWGKIAKHFMTELWMQFFNLCPSPNANVHLHYDKCIIYMYTCTCMYIYMHMHGCIWMKRVIWVLYMDVHVHVEWMDEIIILSIYSSWGFLKNHKYLVITQMYMYLSFKNSNKAIIFC